MTKPLEREYEYYLKNREKLAREFDGKIVAWVAHQNERI